MQVSERGLCDHRRSVYRHAADGLSYPGRVAREERIVLGCSCELYKTQLHYEMVDILLRLLFGDKPSVKVTLDIDVNKRGCSAQRHSRAVLLLDGSKVAEIQPLDSLFSVLCGL